MKFAYKLLSVAFVSFGLSLTSCDDDHKMDWTETAPFDVHVTSVSIADGAVVNTQTSEVVITYDCGISLNSAVSVTLNDAPVSASVVDDNSVVVSLSLSAGQAYTLIVPERAVAGRGSKTFAPELKVSFSTEATTVVTNYDALVNPNASVQAQRVHNYFIQNSGQNIVSGAVSNVNSNNDFAGWVKSMSGKDVAYTCYDFIHFHYSGSNWIDYTDMTPAKDQWNNNGIIGFMWHWIVPNTKEDYENKTYSNYGYNVPGENVDSPSDFDIREALKEGTWQNECILADIDQIAGYLKLYADENIPVIWRPLHEAAGSYKYNGAWFWWGRYGDEYTIALWKLMYDRMTNVHGLNNLIWVWTAQYEPGFESQMAASYPGNDCVDMVAVDIYADNDDAHLDAYNALLSMTGGHKLVTLGEVGRVPDPDKCIAAGANWAYFMIWYTNDIHKTDATVDGFGNTKESLTSVMNSNHVITRDMMPGF